MKTAHHPSPATRVAAVFLALLIPLATAPVSLRASTIFWDAGSGTDFQWNTVTNWSPDGLPTSADNLIFPTPIPNPGVLTNPQIITLGAGELARSLYFQSNYTLTGGDLTLSAGAIRVDGASYTTVASVMHGTAGFTMSGGGTLFLTGVNDFTGLTTIEQGSVVINNAAALGTDTSAIIINGFSSRGVQGGQLVVAPTITPGTIQGITFARSIALSGRGPATDGAALLSIGNNTFSGNIYSSNLGESRIGSSLTCV